MSRDGGDLSAGWLKRVVDKALIDGRITLASAPEWRQRLARDPLTTEAELFDLAAAPSVGEENGRRMEAAAREGQQA